MIFDNKLKKKTYGIFRHRALATVLVLSMVLCMAVPAAAGSAASAGDVTNAVTSVLRFTDVSETDKAYADIKALCDASLINGYPDGTFRPNGTITRAEFVKMINNAFGFVATSGISNPFSDVAEGQWYFDNVMAAVTKGYILGYEDGTFRPDETISRQETAVIIDRIMMLENTVSDEQKSAVTINDSIGAWASNSVKYVVAAGLMDVGSDGSFRAGVPATRAEVAMVCVASLKMMGRVDELGHIIVLDSSADTIDTGSTETGSGAAGASGDTSGSGTGDASGSESGGGSASSSDSSGGTSTADYQTMSAVNGTVKSIENKIFPKIEESTIATDKENVRPLFESVLASMKAYQKDQSYDVEKNAEKVKETYEGFDEATKERVKYYIGFISTQNLSILGERFFGIDVDDYL